ncbi:MAG: FecR domain-containing protein [Elusimicrobia bacterium]|nr:FecR domain-containing protein [Elusimicrobiota bacterium]
MKISILLFALYLLSPRVHAQDARAMAAAALEEARVQKMTAQKKKETDLDLLRRTRGSKNVAAQMAAQQAVNKDDAAIRQAEARERRIQAWLDAIEKGGPSAAALLAHSKGQVKVLRAGVEGRPDKGYIFQDGDELQTGANGTAELRFTDGASATLGSNTALRLNELISPSRKASKFELLKGILHWEIPPRPEGHREIITETGAISAQGAELDILLEKNGLTTVRMYEGVAEVSARPENLSRQKVKKWWENLYW